MHAADTHEGDDDRRSHSKRLITSMPAAAATMASVRPGSAKKEKDHKEKQVAIVIPGKFQLKKPANWIVIVTLAIEFVQMAWFPLQVRAPWRVCCAS